MRAICSDETPIGFMMTSENPEQGEYFLWRMMLNQHHQRKVYGARAIKLLIERIAGDGRVLLLSHLNENSDAGRFYSGLGFTYTGEILGDDLVMSLPLPRRYIRPEGA